MSLGYVAGKVVRVEVPQSEFARPLQWVAFGAWVLAVLILTFIFVDALKDYRATKQLKARAIDQYQARASVVDIGVRTLGALVLAGAAATWLVISAPQPGLAILAGGLNSLAAVLLAVNALSLNFRRHRILAGPVSAQFGLAAIQETVETIDSKVTTANGRSIGTLAELNEGRRIRAEVPVKKRTKREQAYVDLLERVEREGSSGEIEEDAKGEEG